jgi:hypothetical protein
LRGASSTTLEGRRAVRKYGRACAGFDVGNPETTHLSERMSKASVWSAVHRADSMPDVALISYKTAL